MANPQQKPKWEQRDRYNYRDWMLMGTPYYVVQPKNRAAAKAIDLPRFMRYVVCQETDNPHRPKQHGMFSQIAEAKWKAIGLAGLELAGLKLTQAQQKTIAQWQAQGWTIESLKMERGVFRGELRRSQYWEFPEWCPYANPKVLREHIRLEVNRRGTANVKPDFTSLHWWACDYPQGWACQPTTELTTQAKTRSNQLGLPL